MVKEIALLPIQRNLYSSTKSIAGIYSSRATGKTYVMSWLIVLSLLREEKSIAFSQSYKSLTQNLFDEVLKRLVELGVEYRYNKSSCCIGYGERGLCYGFSYENVESVRGLTECSYMFCDELALAPKDLFSITAPCLRGTGIVPRIRFASTPRAGSYWNEQVKKHREDWDIFTGTMRENKFLSPESIRMAEEAITDPLMRRQELYGEILEGTVENCIVDVGDFALTERVEGGVECGEEDRRVYCGIDFARTGDNTVITFRNQSRILEQVKLNRADTESICGTYRILHNRYHPVRTMLDSTGGFDIGFYDTMKKEVDSLVEVNFGGAGSDVDLNARSLMYFRLADAIRAGFYIDSARYQDTIDQIKATSYFLTNAGKRALVPKNIIKDIVGHSPDEADSLALTFYPVDDLLASSTVSYQRCGELTRLLFR